MIKVYIVEYKRGNKPLAEEVREFKTTLQAEIFINKFNLVTKLRASKQGKVTYVDLDWCLVASRLYPIGGVYAKNVFLPRSVEL